MLAVLLDLVLPAECAACGRLGAELCPACRAELLAPPLGRHSPTPRPAGLPDLAVARAYDGCTRALLLAHKERARLRVGRPLGAALASAVQVLGVPRGTVLVPVPSSRAAVRSRGFDHAARLATAAGRQAGLPVARLLRPTRRVADQSGLGSLERAVNLAGALQARPSADGRPVVVVDDVVTTGVTMAEATRALCAAGAMVLGAAAVAGTQRRAPA